MDMSERVYIPGRGPRWHKGVEFGVSQAARFLKIYLNDGALWLKTRWQTLEPRLFYCQWVYEGREDALK